MLDLMKTVAVAINKPQIIQIKQIWASEKLRIILVKKLRIILINLIACLFLNKLQTTRWRN